MAAAVTPRVLRAVASGAPVAATFGDSLFDAVGPPTNVRSETLAERRPVRLREEWRGEDAVVVVGPEAMGGDGWSLALGRAVDSHSVLSVECPAVGLGRAGWYRTQPRRMPHMRLGVVAAVLDSQDRVLLTRRAAHMRSFPASWVLPGGGLDPGEELLEGMMREASPHPHHPSLRCAPHRDACRWWRRRGSR